MSAVTGRDTTATRKAFRNPIPVTSYRITAAGQKAIDGYRKALLEGLRKR